MNRFLGILSILILVFSVLLYVITHWIQNLTINQIWEILYLFSPLFAVLLLNKEARISLKQDMSISWKGIKNFIAYALLTALLFPGLILFFRYILGNIFEFEWAAKVTLSNMQPNAFKPFLDMLLFNIGAGLTLGLLLAFGGETAWRGYLERNLSLNRFVKYTLIGLVWGLWYTPVIIQHINTQNLAWTIITTILFYIALSFYLSNILAKTKNIFTTAGIVGIINCTSLGFITGYQGNALITGNTGLLALISIVILNAVLFIRFPAQATH